MRTKHLLYTLAFAGAFTACTQDEFVADGGTDVLAGRKSLGKVSFVERDADTRWAVNGFNSIKPEANDGFSLYLVDVPRTGLDGQHLYPIDNYDVVDNTQTNYAFKLSANGRWDSEANLVEGNYLYVAPAQKNQSRKPAEIVLPTEQNLAFAADGKTLDPLSAVKEFAKSGYPFYVGHRFISEGGDLTLPYMRNIFSYPLITVKNTDAYRVQKPILTKVIIKQDAENPFIINAPLAHGKAVSELTSEVFEKKGSDKKDKVVVGGWAGSQTSSFGANGEYAQVYDKTLKVNVSEISKDAEFEAYTVEGSQLKYYMYNNGLKGATDDLLGAPTATSQYIVINMPKGGIELAYGKSISFNAIMPADSYVFTNKNSEKKGVAIYAVLADGYAYKKVMDSNTTVDMFPGKQYPDQDYTGLEPKGDQGLYFTVDINDGASDGISTYKKENASEIGGVTTVSSTQKLIDAIVAHTSTENLNITVANGVEYTEAVNRAVANTKCQNVNIQGHVSIIGGKADSPLAISNRVTIEDAVIEEGEVTVSSEAFTGKVFVAPEATLNMTSNASGDADLYNAGTLKLGTAQVGNVKNYGKLLVATDLSSKSVENLFDNCEDILYWTGKEIISPAIKLIPSVELLAKNPAAGYPVNGKYKAKGDVRYEITVNKSTELVVEDGTKLTNNWVDKERGNAGKIINNGTVSGTDATLTVEGGLEIENNAGATITDGVSIVLNAGSFDQWNGLTVGARLSNAGVIEGKVTVNAEDEAEINQTAARLTMEANGARVAEVDGNGEVDNTMAGAIAKTSNNSNLTIYAATKELKGTYASDATWAAIKNAVTNGKVNTVRLTGTWTVNIKFGALASQQEITKFQFDNNSVLNLTTDVAAVSFGSVAVEVLGKTTWNGRGSSSVTGSFTKLPYYEKWNGQEWTNVDCEVVYNGVSEVALSE